MKKIYSTTAEAKAALVKCNKVYKKAKIAIISSLVSMALTTGLTFTGLFCDELSSIPSLLCLGGSAIGLSTVSIVAGGFYDSAIRERNKIITKFAISLDDEESEE